MNFSKKRPVKIVMLGAGGTGAHIAPHLYRLLYALERPVKFIICDGDKVEPKNLVRQNFTEADLGENKARVIAERYSDVFGLETSYIPRFIEDAGQLEELLRPEVFRHYVYGSEPNTGRWVTNSELVILIGAVDNNKSRKLCHEVFLRARDLVYIDSGNGEYPGRRQPACAGTDPDKREFFHAAQQRRHLLYFGGIPDPRPGLRTGRISKEAIK